MLIHLSYVFIGKLVFVLIFNTVYDIIFKNKNGGFKYG